VGRLALGWRRVSGTKDVAMDILPTHPPAELLKFRMFSLQETRNIRIISPFKICNKAHP
jgi:hypothetical protein